MKGGTQQKKPFSLSDDDDDSDSASDSGSEHDPDDKKGEAADAAAKMVNGSGVGGVIVRQRTPSETGSDDSDDESSEL